MNESMREEFSNAMPYVHHPASTAATDQDSTDGAITFGDECISAVQQKISLPLHGAASRLIIRLSTPLRS